MGEIEELRKQISELQKQLLCVHNGGVTFGKARLDRSLADPTYWRLQYCVESDRVKNGAPYVRWSNLAMRKDRNAIIEEIPKLISDMQNLYDTLKAEG